MEGAYGCYIDTRGHSLRRRTHVAPVSRITHSFRPNTPVDGALDLITDHLRDLNPLPSVCLFNDTFGGQVSSRQVTILLRELTQCDALVILDNTVLSERARFLALGIEIAATILFLSIHF